MRRAAAFALISFLALGASLAAAQPSNDYWSEGNQQSDWERAQREKHWKEGEVKLPPYPKPANLIGFQVSAASDFKFFIDSASLSVTDDGVVRYTLVARSPSGVENASYEGIHCRDGTYKVYAFGGAGGRWSRNALAQWRPIEASGPTRWHRVLERDFFCPRGIRVASASDALAALKRGGIGATNIQWR